MLLFKKLEKTRTSGMIEEQWRSAKATAALVWESKHAAVVALMVALRDCPLNLDLGISRREKIPEKGDLFSCHQ